MSDVNRLLAEIPNSVRAITGVDLTKVSWAQRLAWKLSASQGASPSPALTTPECRQCPASPSCSPNSFSLPLLQLPLFQKATEAKE